MVTIFQEACNKSITAIEPILVYIPFSFFPDGNSGGKKANAPSTSAPLGQSSTTFAFGMPTPLTPLNSVLDTVHIGMHGDAGFCSGPSGCLGGLGESPIVIMPPEIYHLLIYFLYLLSAQQFTLGSPISFSQIH